MARISEKEEKRLFDAVARSIEYVNTGMHPNLAIEKVAKEEKYTPPFIRKMSAAFNKSASVAKFTKEASPEKRKESFELADPAVIITRIYREAEAPVEKIACTVPEFAIGKEELEKAAASVDSFAEYDGITWSGMCRKIDQCRSAHNLLKKELQVRENAAQESFMDCVDKLAGQVRSMPEPDLQKMARLTVNGFPVTGEKMLKLLALKSGRPITNMQKTASAAVFPSREPYFTLAKLHLAAEQFVRARNDNAYFSKYAEGIVSDVLDQIGGSVTGFTDFLKGKDRDKELAKAKVPELDLDPQFFNALKEVDTRKIFTDLALYDDDLKQHDMPTLVKAFNSSVSAVPEASTNPSVLKTLMLQRINTGNLLDPFQAGQEAVLGKELRGRAEGAKTSLEQAKKKLAENMPAEEPWWKREPQKKEKTDRKGILSSLLSDKEKAPLSKAEDVDKKRIERLMKYELTDKSGKPLSIPAIMDHLHSLPEGKDITPTGFDQILEKFVSGKDLTSQEKSVIDAFHQLV